MKVQNLAYFSLVAAVAARDDTLNDAMANPVYSVWKNQLRYVCKGLDADMIREGNGRMCPEDDCTACILQAWNKYDINCELTNTRDSWKTKKNYVKECFYLNWDGVPIEPTTRPTRPPTEPPTLGPITHEITRGPPSDTTIRVDPTMPDGTKPPHDQTKPTEGPTKPNDLTLPIDFTVRDPVDETRHPFDPEDPTTEPVTDPTRRPFDPEDPTTKPRTDPSTVHDSTTPPPPPPPTTTRRTPPTLPTYSDLRWCSDFCKRKYYSSDDRTNVKHYEACKNICKDRMKKSCYKFYQCDSEYPDRSGSMVPEDDTCRLDCYSNADETPEKVVATKTDAFDITISGFESFGSLSDDQNNRKKFNKADELAAYCTRQCKASDSDTCRPDCQGFLVDCSCLAGTSGAVELKGCMYKCKNPTSNSSLEVIRKHYTAIIDIKDEIRGLCKKHKKCGTHLANGGFKEKSPWAIWRKVKDTVREKCAGGPDPHKCMARVENIFAKMIGDITTADLEKLRAFIQDMEIDLPVE